MTTPHTRRTRPQRRRPARCIRLATDRGSTTVETVGYYAVWLACLLVGVQAALWGLAELACRYSAQHALQATRIEGGSAAAGHRDGTTILAAIGGYLVTDPTITTTRSPDTATVTVHGTAVKLIPFLTVPVQATATGPVEVLAPVP